MSSSEMTMSCSPTRKPATTETSRSENTDGSRISTVSAATRTGIIIARREALKIDHGRFHSERAPCRIQMLDMFRPAMW
jgi:hypothetical protein